MEQLLILGKALSFVFYLVVTFLTQSIFVESKTTDKIISLIVQTIVAGAMILPYWLIDSWRDQLMLQLQMILIPWLITLIHCYYINAIHHSYINSIGKRNTSNKT